MFIGLISVRGNICRSGGMVDTPDSKSGALWHKGSSPFFGTNIVKQQGCAEDRRMTYC